MFGEKLLSPAAFTADDDDEDDDGDEDNDHDDDYI